MRRDDPRATALPPAAGEAPVAGNGGHVLTFLLGDALFATDIQVVREIIQHGAMTSVPLMPHFVRGVINLRGAVVPVIDLQARFGRSPAQIGRKSCIVVCDVVREGERIELGLLVDAVSAVVQIDGNAIEPPPAFGAVVRRDFIRGMCELRKRFVVILEPERTFDIDEMARLCEAAQEDLAA
jgi:purine-binding chemotaxis protein CheW